MRDDVQRPIRLGEYAPPAFRIEEVRLEFTLDPQRTRVLARSSVRRVGPAGAPLVLDGAGFELGRVAVDGVERPLDGLERDGERLTLRDAPDVFTLEVETWLNPAANTALEGLYLSGGRFCTQCEAEGFRKITYWLDRPDALSRYVVRLEADADAYPTLLSNGDLIERGSLPGGRHYAVWRDPHPKPSYLFALVAGRYDLLEDEFVTRSGRRVRLGIHVDPGAAPRAAYAMDSLKRAMRWDEDVFGREYDLDVFNIVAVRDFNFGAMENKGLNIFNSSYVLADETTATDADFEAIESIVAHEYFHNWTGNRITLRDWFQLCLKEGLTVFRDQEFSADQRSRPVQRIKDVRRLRARQFPEDAGPLAHPVRPETYLKIDNFYTATVYEKGAELIRVLQALVGEAAFAAGMQRYFERCDGAAATVEDFLACFAFPEGDGRDRAAFQRWYAQAGTPLVTLATRWDEPHGAVELSLTQATPATPGQPDKSPVPIPLRIGFLDPEGAPMPARLAGAAEAALEHVVILDAPAQTVRFEGLRARPIPAALRGLSAPVRLEDDLSEADRLIQMAHDPDAFTRWEAGQTLARALLLAAAPAEASTAAFVRALAGELERAEADPAFAALALRLPDLADLLHAAAAPDPDALFARREALRRRIAGALAPSLRALAAAPEPERFSPDAASAARRSLKAAALDLLSALGDGAAETLLATFAQSAHMGGKIAALEALGQTASAAFDEALERFYAEWRADPLVLDKWFALQAAAPRADALARVERLRRHPAFSLANPNRARALIGAFAMRNLRAFHAADGSGYRFVIDAVALIDAANPALAARLLGAFEAWRRFDVVRQTAARTALEALAARPALSRNTADILGRTLAERA